MSDKIVLVTDYTWPSTAPEAEVLARVGARLLEAETGSEEELLRLVPEADAILTCFKQVPASVVRAGTKLQVIGRYGIGVDNIPVDEATRLGIPVTNVPAYCLDEVAEHALALLLAGARNIVRYDRAVQADNWSLATGMPVYRVAGRTLAIIGFGKIGRRLARKAAALDLHLLAHDPWVPDEEIRAAGVEPAGLDEALARADFVSLHTPLTEETRHLLNAERLARIKPGAFVINTARGALIDQEALLARAAVRSRQRRGPGRLRAGAFAGGPPLAGAAWRDRHAAYGLLLRRVGAGAGASGGAERGGHIERQAPRRRGQPGGAGAGALVASGVGAALGRKLAEVFGEKVVPDGGF